MSTNKAQQQPQERRHNHRHYQLTTISTQTSKLCACRRQPQQLAQLPPLLTLALVVLFLSFLDGSSALPHEPITTTTYHRSGSQQRQQQLPVIGILSQPSKKLDHSYHYIATSYVDWIEQFPSFEHSDNHNSTSPITPTAIAIPIPYDAPPELLDDLFEQMNGLLLPGGWNGYMPPSVPYLLDKIMESNAAGKYFPVWGTCLGYEFLIKYVGGVDAIQSGFDLYNSSIPLEQVHVRELYHDPIIYDIVTTLPVTLNNHQLGIEPEHFLSNPKLTSVWEITSINYDVNGRPFVSSIEPKDPDSFPVYGVQYHPEKNAYEYTTYPNTTIPYENIDHTTEGIDFSLYLSNFFLEKVRHGMIHGNRHKYTKRNTYPPIRAYTSSTGVKYEDIYIIPYASHWENMIAVNSNNETMIDRNSNIINISTTGMLMTTKTTTPKLKINHRHNNTTTEPNTHNETGNNSNNNEDDESIQLQLTKQEVVDTLSDTTTNNNAIYAAAATLIQASA